MSIDYHGDPVGFVKYFLSHDVEAEQRKALEMIGAYDKQESKSMNLRMCVQSEADNSTLIIFPAIGGTPHRCMYNYHTTYSIQLGYF